MLVYKYVVPERIDVLENGCIRFTQAAAMNDPFEAYPCFSLFNESMRERSYRLLKRMKGTPVQLVIGEMRIPKMIKDGTANFQRELSMNYPMLCLTGKMNNLLMWSHYAAAHYGFVLGFNSDHPFFHHEKPRSMTNLLKVNYSEKRPVVPKFEECGEEGVHEMLFLNKSSHWAYEEEFRMFAKPEAADYVKKDASGFPAYLYKFPPDCLKEIIFGYKTQSHLKQKISDIVEKRYPHVELFEAQLNETEFDLDVIPYRK